jgi:hypothetical protein
MSEVYKPKKQFLLSKHLKAVEIKYCEEFEKIAEILNVLAYHGVQPELITMKQSPIRTVSNYTIRIITIFYCYIMFMSLHA